MAEIQHAFLSLPLVTRSILAATAAVTLPVALGVVSPYQIIFHLPLITKKFQLWRLVTPFFFAGSGLSALFNLFFLFRCTRDLEDGVFRNRSADLAWAVLCMCTGTIGLNYPLKSVILFRALLLALTHLWAQYSPDTPMNLYGFITLPARYISFALLAIDLLQGGPTAAVEGLTGIIAAHVYHYLAEIYPVANPNAAHWLATPKWFKKLLGGPVNSANGGGPPGRASRTVGGATAFAPRSAPNNNSSGSGNSSTTGTATVPNTGNSAASSITNALTGHSWGRGNRLDR